MLHRFIALPELLATNTYSVAATGHHTHFAHLASVLLSLPLTPPLNLLALSTDPSTGGSRAPRLAGDPAHRAAGAAQHQPARPCARRPAAPEATCPERSPSSGGATHGSVCPQGYRTGPCRTGRPTERNGSGSGRDPSPRCPLAHGAGAGDAAVLPAGPVREGPGAGSCSPRCWSRRGWRTPSWRACRPSPVCTRHPRVARLALLACPGCSCSVRTRRSAR